MGKLLEELKTYFENTPDDVLEKDWDAIKHLNDIGPDVMEYAESVRSNFQYVFDEHQAPIPVLFNGKDFGATVKYYMAA